MLKLLIVFSLGSELLIAYEKIYIAMENNNIPLCTLLTFVNIYDQ